MKKKKVVKVAPKKGPQIDPNEALEDPVEEATETPSEEAKEDATEVPQKPAKGKQKGPKTAELVGLLKGAMKKPGGAMSRSNYGA